MRHPFARTAGAALAVALMSAAAGLTACAPAAQETPVATPTVTSTPVATATAETTTSTTPAQEATTQASTTTQPSTTTKPKPQSKPTAGTITKAQAALAIKKAVNATLDKDSDARATVTAVDVKVLEKDADGTYWAGAYLTNDLDGGIVFLRKKAGDQWDIIDLGTGIDGSEMKGQAPSAIAAKFVAEFTP